LTDLRRDLGVDSYERDGILLESELDIFARREFALQEHAHGQLGGPVEALDCRARMCGRMTVETR